MPLPVPWDHSAKGYKITVLMLMAFFLLCCCFTANLVASHQCCFVKLKWHFKLKKIVFKGLIQIHKITILCSLCWGNPGMFLVYKLTILYLELNVYAVCWSCSMSSLTFVVFRHDRMCSQKTNVSIGVSSLSIVYIPGQKRD